MTTAPKPSSSRPEASRIREVKLRQGTIRYRDEGTGPVIVFVHGLLVNGSVWRNVAGPLASRFRCITPDWPLGSHGIPMNEDADLTPEGIAKIVAAFLEALDLRDVILVGNDSGGAICQLVVARHGDRVGRLVLTTCDAFEVFPPRLFDYLKVVSRIPGVMALLGRAMLAIPFLRRAPIAYGIVAKHRIDDAVTTEWIRPSATNAKIRRDLAKLLAGISPRVTMGVVPELTAVQMPVLLLWTPEDRCFPISLAERLSTTFPDARLVRIDDAFVFVQEDQPDEVVTAIDHFVVTSRTCASEPRLTSQTRASEPMTTR